jgi:hypothetical protein
MIGLCASCTNAHPITSSKGSVFIRCDLSFNDPRFPRYPALPVLRCSGYRPQVEGGGDNDPSGEPR